MGSKFGNFKYQIGDIITTNGRNLKIISTEYRPKTCLKNGKTYVNNAKWYKYKCLYCGNEDYIIEFSLDNGCGCNVCCIPPRKVLKGYNDIMTTSPWMVKYFVDVEEAYTNSKYSAKVIKMRCSDCGRIYNKSISSLYAAKTLFCVCHDNVSYPNKFMYSLLSQFNIDFEIEKVFPWSERRKYDFWLHKNGKSIIVEQHGLQHYQDVKFNGTTSDKRSLSEEKANDIHKQEMALIHGIDFYYQIDCSNSTMGFIRQSIIESGLLDTLEIDASAVDWVKCDMFATSNFVKQICEYRSAHEDITLHDIAKIFHMSYTTVLSYIKSGNKFGWCNYELGSDRILTEQQKRVNHGAKPIFCENNSQYYHSSNVAEKVLSSHVQRFYARQIRQSITRNQKYFGLRFRYITDDEFLKAKSAFPNNVFE